MQGLNCSRFVFGFKASGHEALDLWSDRNVFNVCFRRSKFESVQINGSYFRHCDFTRAQFNDNATIQNTKFENCCFNETTFKKTKFDDVKFYNDIFEGVRWNAKSTRNHKIEVVDSVFVGGFFDLSFFEEKSEFSGLHFISSAIVNTDFRRFKLKGNVFISDGCKCKNISIDLEDLDKIKFAGNRKKSDINDFLHVYHQAKEISYEQALELLEVDQVKSVESAEVAYTKFNKKLNSPFRLAAFRISLLLDAFLVSLAMGLVIFMACVFLVKSEFWILSISFFVVLLVFLRISREIPDQLSKHDRVLKDQIRITLESLR